jgi:hypothetical protein
MGSSRLNNRPEGSLERDRSGTEQRGPRRWPEARGRAICDQAEVLRGTRRSLLGAVTTYLLVHLCSAHSFAQIQTNEPMTLSPPLELAPTLLSAPIELAGNWGHMLPCSADLVVKRMRHSCLDGVRLVSDRQPTGLRVEEHTSGPPAVWLHPDGSSMAWIIVDIGEHAWVQLAYQFGHELGHVLANSWQPHAAPKFPCQWLEEAMVEAFSLRGLGRLAESWKKDPPFPGDNEFGNAIADYRRNIVEGYSKLVAEQGLTRDPAAWFSRNRSEIEMAGLIPFGQAASLTILAEYERAPECVEALGALNRWPDRSGVPLEDYLRQWEASCAELHATPILPARLREVLRIP